MISADTVILQFTQDPDPESYNQIITTVKLYSSIPDRVSPDWTSPDSLLYVRDVNAGVVIKSP